MDIINFHFLSWKNSKINLWTKNKTPRKSLSILLLFKGVKVLTDWPQTNYTVQIYLYLPYHQGIIKIQCFFSRASMFKYLKTVWKFYYWEKHKTLYYIVERRKSYSTLKLIIISFFTSTKMRHAKRLLHFNPPPC